MCDKSQNGTASSEVLIENTRVRVTRWSFANKGDNTGWHRHEHDYIVVPQFDGRLKINLPGDQHVTADLKSGEPYFRELGTQHDVISANGFPCAFIEIELLDKKG